MESNQGHLSPATPEDGQENDTPRRSRRGIKVAIGATVATGLTLLGLHFASEGGSNPIQTPDKSKTTSAPAETPSASPSETAPALTNHEILLAEMTKETPEQFFLRDPAVRADWCEEVPFADLTDIATAIQSVAPDEFHTLPEATTTNTPQEILNILYYHDIAAYTSHKYKDSEGIPPTDPADTRTGFDLPTTRKVASCSYLDMTSTNAVKQDGNVQTNFLKGAAQRMPGYYPGQPGYAGYQYVSSEPESTTNGYWSESISDTQIGANNGSVATNNFVRVPFQVADKVTGVESTHYTYMLAN